MKWILNQDGLSEKSFTQSTRSAICDSLSYLIPAFKWLTQVCPDRFGWVALLFAPLLSVHVSATEGTVVIETHSGHLRGEVVEGVRRFRGIPYAMPPIGDLRWRAPLEVRGWDGIRDALEFGPACSAPSTSVGGIGTAAGDGWDLIAAPARPDTSEDCLTLNIWAPLEATGDAPVMVFTSSVGEGSLPFWDGTGFAQKGMVLVTFNQRMWTHDAFPHPTLRSQASDGTADVHHSFGKLDQLKVLEWVKENAAAFGGNPDNVTIFGQSAGGRYVLQIMATKGVEGLFHRAIVQSCCAWSPLLTLEDAEMLAIAQLNSIGLNGEDIGADSLRQLDLGKVPIAVGVLKEDLVAAIEQGHLVDVPLLIGGTDWDGSSMRRTTPSEFVDQVPHKVRLAYADEAKTLSKRQLGYAIYTDEHVNAPARWIAREVSRNNVSPVYRYLFSHVVSLRAGQQGAAHTDDIPFIFNSWEAIFESMGIQRALPDIDQRVTDLVQDCWISFARDGRPICGESIAWPATTPDNDVIVEIDSALIVHEDFRKSQYDAIESWVMESMPKRIDVAEVLRALENLQALSDADSALR